MSKNIKEALPWIVMFLAVIAYGWMLGFLTVAAHEECGGWTSCIDEAIKQDKVNE